MTIGFIVWTVLPGIASIISLVLALIDKFPKWKTPLLIFSGFFLCLTLLRFIPIHNNSISPITINPGLDIKTIFIGSIAISLIITILVSLLGDSNKAENAKPALFTLLILSFFSLMIIAFSGSDESDIPPSDYLKLAQTYENEKNYIFADVYYEKYWNKASLDPNERDLLKKKREEIHSKKIKVSK